MYPDLPFYYMIYKKCDSKSQMTVDVHSFIKFELRNISDRVSITPAYKHRA